MLFPGLEALCRVLFEFESEGAEHVPAHGPAVVAANHPSYLDPMLLSLSVARPIRFMGWDALFKVPLLGALLRAFGAFPVDVRPGQGRAAYERAKALVLAGEVVGIFPEGRRSQTGWMEARLREGAARLAWETGAPLVPATIAGAFRAWPHFRWLPRPARVRVRFHEPIDPTPFRSRAEDEALPALLGLLRERVERVLLPSVRADHRIEAIYRRPAAPARLFEWLPALALALGAWWRGGVMAPAVAAAAWVLYLVADRAVVPPSRLAKRVRHVAAPAVILGLALACAPALGLPATPAPAALYAILGGAVFPYFYERGPSTRGFLRGLVVAVGGALVALAYAPSPAAFHVVLPVFAAAWAWEGRTVSWTWSAPVLLAYAGGTSALLAHGQGLLPALTAGLLSWMAARTLPPDRAPGPEVTTALVGLGLHDGPPEDRSAHP